MKINILPFSKVITDSTKNFTKVKKQDYLESGKYSIIDQGKDFICGYTNKEEFVNFDNIPLIVFGDHTKVFKYIDFPIAIGADGVKVLTVDSHIADTKYIYYYLKSLNLHDAGYSRHFKYLKVKKIILPEDKDDQIKIANLLSQVEALIAKREESIELLDELLKSTFLDMFGDPVLNPKGWDKVPLSKLGEINRGVSKHRPRNAPELLGGKYPLIQTGDVANADLYVEKFTQTYSDIGLSQSKLWKKDTLCITIAANIAKTAILKLDACFPDSIVGMEINKEETNLFYVHFLFKFFQKLLEKNAPQAAQKNINLKILRNLKVPKPDKTLQDKFATVVQQVEATKAHYQDSLDELNELFGSLSQRAFRGELDLSKMIIVKVSEATALDVPSSSGAEDIEIVRHKTETIEGSVKSGAGDLYEQIDETLEAVKSIDTKSIMSFSKQVMELQDSLNFDATIQQLTEAKKLFSDIEIASGKIKTPPLNSEEYSTYEGSMELFELSQRLMKMLNNREKNIYKMLEDIPQIKKAMEEGVLSKDDFLELTVSDDDAYTNIKKMIMTKLKSSKLAQEFDEDSKSIKLVKA